MTKYFHYEKEFRLESGQYLPRLTLAYHTMGTMSHDGSNVIWIIHALTADSNPSTWWKGVVGPGLAIDTNRFFVVCANTLGSHYGSTNPLSVDPIVQKCYHHNFPLLTNRDVVSAFKLLADHLQINQIATLIGASIGGQQALEWAIMYATMIRNLIPIATNAIHSSYGIAFNESQRMAIELDPSWQKETDDAGLAGLKVARSVALISYRTKYGYDQTQQRTADSTDHFAASSYQRYQGEKLAARFNAFSYYLLTKMMDSHDIARNRGSLQQALAKVRANTTVISISSDILFPPPEQQLLQQGIANSSLIEIDSNFGHDGFLVEVDRISAAIGKAISATYRQATDV